MTRDEVVRAPQGVPGRGGAGRSRAPHGGRVRRRAAALLMGAVVIGLVTGCGNTVTPAAAVPPSATPAAPSDGANDDDAPPIVTPPNGTVVSILFERGRLARKSDQVEVGRGSTVLLAVSTDVADEIHLHGYERVAPTKPGERAVLEFTADRSGVYTAELERSGVSLLVVTVP